MSESDELVAEIDKVLRIIDRSHTAISAYEQQIHEGQAAIMVLDLGASNFFTNSALKAIASVGKDLSTDREKLEQAKEDLKAWRNFV